MSDYGKLTRLAEAATPGEWQAYDTHGKRFIESMIGEAHVVCDTPKKQWLKDSEYIAAVSPVDVLALIAENKRLAELLECAQGDCRQAMQIIERLTPDAERYRFFRDSQQVTDNGDGWSVMYLDNGAGGFGGGVCQADFTSLDEATDFAMSKQVQP
jgi:hypothetical protein